MFIIVEKIANNFISSVYLLSKILDFQGKINDIFFCVVLLRQFFFDCHTRLRSFLNCCHDLRLVLFLGVLVQLGFSTIEYSRFPCLSQYDICLGVKKTKQYNTKNLINLYQRKKKKNELITTLTGLISTSTEFHRYYISRFENPNIVFSRR